MKVALLGATGFVGSALLKEALDRGHVATAIVRDPERLEKREGLTAKAGDVYDTASHPSSPRLRRRESKGCSGWAERVGWRSHLE
jgi:putative NADH-flavin reductase